jgi:hypothetical protein
VTLGLVRRVFDLRKLARFTLLGQAKRLPLLFGLHGKVEILLGIAVADVFDEAAEERFVVG